MRKITTLVYGNGSNVSFHTIYNYITGKKSRFPYLKTPDLSDAEREMLMGRLKNETDEMKESFALLIEETLLSLMKHEVSSDFLKWSMSINLH